MMNLIKYLILGIIQGITEPLPISSSGHLLIFRELFNTNMFNDLNFEIIANFGSFLAIFIIYFQDIKRLFVNFFKYSFTKDKNLKEDFKYVIMIFVASIPVGIFGLIFKSKLEKIASVKMVAIALLITGFTLLLIKNVHGIKEDKD